MEGTHEPGGGERTVLVRPNCSLSPAERRFFLVFIASLTLGVALAFASLGAWPVLPFAGLEVGVLVWAFRQLALHAADYEKISINGDRVLVELQVAGRVDRFEFNRHWARVVMGVDVSGEPRVSLRSHGREVELGRLIAPEAREALARKLRIQLQHD